MPFIDCKITKELSEEQKEELKSRLGRAVSVLHKPESYLMVGIADGYNLYFAGEKLQSGAYVEISLFGSASSNDYEKMTAEVCKILSAFSVPAKNVYVTYHPVKDWGWNGANF